MQPEALSALIAEFRKLPAVGLKTATRYAYAVIDMDVAEAEEFAEAVRRAKSEIHFCTQCGNYTDREVCERCLTADKRVICVVAEPRDVTAFEKLGTYDGLYHTYIARLIKPLGIKVTRLAHGIPIGSEIEYTDEMTLGKALSDRKEI